MAFLSYNNIYFAYPGAHDAIFNEVTFSVEQGARIGITGDNGSGKSTLLHIGVGLLQPTRGQVVFEGRPCEKEQDFVPLRKKLGYLLQQAEDQLFCPTILEDVAFAPVNAGIGFAEAEQMAQKILAELEIEHLAGCCGVNVSGGEQKIAALATLLVSEPQCMFLDEPTNDLDAKAREKLLTAIKKRNTALVTVSHDKQFLQELCTEFYVLAKGKLQQVEYLD